MRRAAQRFAGEGAIGTPRAAKGDGHIHIRLGKAWGGQRLLHGHDAAQQLRLWRGYVKRSGNPRGGGFQFEDETVGGSIPHQFIPAIEKGVRQVLDGGAIAGYQLQDVKVIVYDGKYHPVDSKEIAFVTAGRKAFLDAIAKARPIVLEPIVNLDASVPEQHVGDVTGSLASKRARINGTDSMRGGELVVKAQVPMAEVGDYANELKAVTGGIGRYTIEFSHYEPVPPQVQKQLVEAFRPKADED